MYMVSMDALLNVNNRPWTIFVCDSQTASWYNHKPHIYLKAIKMKHLYGNE